MNRVAMFETNDATVQLTDRQLRALRSSAWQTGYLDGSIVQRQKNRRAWWGGFAMGVISALLLVLSLAT